jgi:ABC-type sulfate transport system substrate-binding protein
VIVANPKTAGVARWIFLALWGSKMKKGAAAAKEYVTKVGQTCGQMSIKQVVWHGQ